MIDFTVHAETKKFNTWGVEIDTGKYKGVVFEIADMVFSEEDPGLMTFDYYVIHVPKDFPETREELTKSKEFEKTLQTIMQIIIEQAYEYSKQVLKDEEASDTMVIPNEEENTNDRTNNSSKPISE